MSEKCADSVEEERTILPLKSRDHVAEVKRSKLAGRVVEGAWSSKTQLLTEPYAGERIVGLRAWQQPDSCNAGDPQTLPLSDENKCDEGKDEHRDLDSKSVTKKTDAGAKARGEKD